MLILEILLGLKYNKVDVTAAFLHADLGKDEKVFVDMPRCFEVKGKNGRPKVLKLFMDYSSHQEPSGIT